MFSECFSATESNTYVKNGAKRNKDLGLVDRSIVYTVV